MSLARRNLFQDKTRLLLSIGRLALAVMLILILKGFLAGMNRQITSYLDNSPGAIVIAEEDVVNLLGATSLIPEGIDQKADSVRGMSVEQEKTISLQRNGQTYYFCARGCRDEFISNNR